jgi:hypothetical protein
MIYEVRFQTVEPQRRDAYVKMYKEAIQGCKEAGCRSGKILCSEEDPSRVWFCSSGRAKNIILTGAARQHTGASAPLSKAGSLNPVKAAIMLPRISSAP